MGSTLSWSEIQLAGHRCDVFEPSTPSEHGFVLVYLHGVHLNRLVDQPVFEAEFERHRLPVIAPITGRSWWTDKICPEFDPKLTAERHILDNILPYIRDRWGAEPPRIGLFGTSMGGQGALRLAFKHPAKFPVAAAISPAIDYQLRWREGDETLPQMYPDAEAARQDTATLHVHPLNWPRNLWFCCDPNDYRWHESADRLRMKLAALGIPHECDLETTAGGHGFDYYNAMAPRAVSFLVERLEKERRRVV
jgi:enterochelin esterase-like enzyme